MPSVEVDPEPLYVFVLDHEYVFRRYVSPNDLFDELRDHYDADEYRFEVPARDWDDVAATLRDYHYDPTVVEDVEDFVVVKEQYTTHAAILRDSVANWTRRGHNFFLMKDPLSVERAVQEQGATPASETDLAVGL